MVRKTLALTVLVIVGTVLAAVAYVVDTIEGFRTPKDRT